MISGLQLFRNRETSDWGQELEGHQNLFMRLPHSYILWEVKVCEGSGLIIKSDVQIRKVEPLPIS